MKCKCGKHELVKKPGSKDYRAHIDQLGKGRSETHTPTGCFNDERQPNKHGSYGFLPESKRVTLA